jgi:outer membrane protein OmpA-like peptidoglycan-associated protein
VGRKTWRCWLLAATAVGLVLLMALEPGNASSTTRQQTGSDQGTSGAKATTPVPPHRPSPGRDVGTPGVKPLAPTVASKARAKHAVDLGNKAATAQQSAEQARARIDAVEAVVANIDQYKATYQTEIRFAPGQSTLGKSAKEVLDTVASMVKDQRGYVIEVQAFSPDKGAAAISESQRMDDSIVRYLVLSHDVPVHRIYLVGFGNAPVEEEKAENQTNHHRGGHVEIQILKTEVEQPAGPTKP